MTYLAWHGWWNRFGPDRTSKQGRGRGHALSVCLSVFRLPYPWHQQSSMYCVFVSRKSFMSPIVGFSFALISISGPTASCSSASRSGSLSCKKHLIFGVKLDGIAKKGRFLLTASCWAWEGVRSRIRSGYGEAHRRAGTLFDFAQIGHFTEFRAGTLAPTPRGTTAPDTL